MKRIIMTSFLFIFMVLPFFTNVSAAEVVNVEIANQQDLFDLRELIKDTGSLNSGTGSSYVEATVFNVVLTDNIEIDNWTSGLGSDAVHFNGTFDGQGHTINFVGGVSDALFDVVGGTVNITNLNTTGNFEGLVRDFVRDAENGASLTITGCTNTADYLTGSSTIAAFLTYTSASEAEISITNCINKGDVSTTLLIGGASGFIGDAGYNNIVTFTDCYNSGDVSGEFASGFIGFGANTKYSITGCVNTGTMTQTAGVSAGFVTNCTSEEEASLIQNCANYGNALYGMTCESGNLQIITSYSATNVLDVFPPLCDSGNDFPIGVEYSCYLADTTTIEADTTGTAKTLDEMTGFAIKDILGTNWGLTGMNLPYPAAFDTDPEILAHTLGAVLDDGAIRVSRTSKGTIATTIPTTGTSFTYIHEGISVTYSLSNGAEPVEIKYSTPWVISKEDISSTDYIYGDEILLNMNIEKSGHFGPSTPTITYKNADGYDITIDSTKYTMNSGNTNLNVYIDGKALDVGSYTLVFTDESGTSLEYPINITPFPVTKEYIEKEDPGFKEFMEKEQDATTDHLKTGYRDRLIAIGIANGNYGASTNVTNTSISMYIEFKDNYSGNMTYYFRIYMPAGVQALEPAKEYYFTDNTDGDPVSSWMIQGEDSGTIYMPKNVFFVKESKDYELLAIK